MREVRELPGGDVLAAVLERRRLKPADLADTPVAATLRKGTLASWAIVDPAKSVFEQQTLVRRAMQPLLDEKPETLSIAVFGSADERRSRGFARRPVRVAERTCTACAEEEGDGAARADRPARGAARCGTAAPGGGGGRQSAVPRADGAAAQRAHARTVPGAGAQARARARLGDRGVRPETPAHAWARARSSRWPRAAPRRTPPSCVCGAGARGARTDVRPGRQGHLLRHRRPQSQVRPVHAGHAQGHERLGGGARHPARRDRRRSCRSTSTRWLALAQNHIGPRAYKQNDVVTALDGTTIEIVHTDAEGRMVLADTLTLAARAKPDVIVDFATLTGSMKAALGNRYCGIFATATS